MTIEEINHNEEEAVKELRRRFLGEMEQKLYEDTNMFERFLRARNHNLNAAEAMLRNHLQWRKINKIDTILTDYTRKEAFDKYVPMDTMGLDKEGSPVWFWDLGNGDLKGIAKSLKKSDIMKSIIQELEKSERILKEQTAKRGKTVDKSIHVLNFENLPLSTATHKPTLEIVRCLIQMYEANYPERLKLAIVYNASVIFSIAFAVIKPFLTGHTVRKIKIFGKEGWKEEIMLHADASVIPAFLGGTRTDPDGNPMCNTIVHHGSPIPESYYLQKNKKTIINNPDVKKLSVSRMSKTEMPLYISEPGFRIEWEFETKNGDIGFALLYKGGKHDGKEAEVLLPRQRIDTELATETGMFHCDKPGVYIIEFDNSYSWWHQKEVFCKTAVTEVKSVE